jgi:hypothetical protein
MRLPQCCVDVTLCHGKITDSRETDGAARDFCRPWWLYSLLICYLILQYAPLICRNAEMVAQASASELVKPQNFEVLKLPKPTKV